MLGDSGGFLAISSRLLVLGWHAIDATWSFSDQPERRRELFTRQLWSIDRWATVLSLSEAVDRLEARELPPRAVVLSFDDGYRDVADVVVPALAELGLPATFFLVPDLLDGGSAWWEDLASAFRTATAPALTWQGRTLDTSSPQARRHAHAQVLPGLKDLTHEERVVAVGSIRTMLRPSAPAPTGLFATWDDAAAIVAAGYSVGSHTMSHAILARESPQDQLAELVRSRAVLTERLGGSIDTLAYPNGTTADFDRDTLEATREAGYRCALTTAPGLASRGAPLGLRRVIVDPTTDVRSLAVRGGRDGPQPGPTTGRSTADQRSPLPIDRGRRASDGSCPT